MERQLTRYEALCLALEKAGSQEKLADLLGVSQPAVSGWIKRSKQLPPEYVLMVEAATGVSRHMLRPDIYPRGLVDGIPYAVEGAPMDECGPIVPSNRAAGFDGRDRHAGTDQRFYGAAR